MFVITGGGSGIGRALATTLASQKQQVLIVGRRQQMLDEVVMQSPDAISALCADLSLEIERDRLIEHLHGQQITALVHNAATLEPLKKLQQLSLSEWRQAQQINVEAPLFLTSALLPQLKGGRVLHLSTAMAHMASVGWGCYCVTKSALYMLYELFKKEETDVSFGSVMPGITETNMQLLLRSSSELSPEDKTFFNQLHEEKRLLKPQAVAAFLSYLLLKTSAEVFSEREWDIYDKSHHSEWRAEHSVPEIFGE